MTNALAVRLNEEDRATVAQPSLAKLATYVDACTEMDGEVLGEYIERNWDSAVGNALGLMFLVKEMKRRFKLLDRKKQVNGEYLTIRGFKSFDGWFTSFTGKSRRLAYYLLETEEKKNERNAGRRTSEKKDTDSATFVARCGDAKKKLAEIQRQRNNFKGGDYAALLDQIDPTIDEIFQEFLAFIAPEGCEILKGSSKGWSLLEKDEDEPELQEQAAVDRAEKRAKRSAAAKKGVATKAIKKLIESDRVNSTCEICHTEPATMGVGVIWMCNGCTAGHPNAKDAQPLVKAKPAPPATSLGECEHCGDGTLATEVVNVSEYSKGDNVCAKCAEGTREYERKYLIRQMGVAKVMGKMCSLKRLADLGGKTMDFGDGDVRTYPTVADYIARVREEFLGNPRYDQTVVVEHVARLEKKTELAKALAAAGGVCPEDEAL